MAVSVSVYKVMHTPPRASTSLKDRIFAIESGFEIDLNMKDE